MFNHARTLLMNVSGASDPGPDYLGAELVPDAYVAKSLSTPLQNIRRHLFGSDPDKAMLNYRAHQLLSTIEKTSLQEFVTDLDPRITYQFGEDHNLANHETWDPKVLKVVGNPEDILTVSGAAIRPDYVGRLYYQFAVSLTGSAIVIDRETPPVKSETTAYSLTNGLSPPFDLIYTGYKIYVNTTSGTAAWSISGYLRPQLSFIDLVQALDKAGDPTLTALFGTKSIEPWSTFKNLWYDSPDVIYRLGAITLALIYRTDEAKVNE